LNGRFDFGSIRDSHQPPKELLLFLSPFTTVKRHF
jgi:hypothetical protein